MQCSRNILCENAYSWNRTIATTNGITIVTATILNLGSSVLRVLGGDFIAI